MKLTAPREEILAPLQSVIGVVERRQTMPVLSNVLVAARNNRLSLTGTDLEVELVCTRDLQVQQAGEITVPGRKFLDILKALPDGVEVTISTDGDRLVIKAGRSRFTLATLPAAEFPLVDEINAQQTLKLPHAEFRRLIDKTHFSMAQQDVRYYLNGMLLEAEGKQLRAVATDGHRLALCETSMEIASRSKQQVIIPRKGVLELQRILGAEGEIEVAIGTNHIRAQIGGIRFTSKLVDGRFPEYGRVIPANASRIIDADRDILRHSLQRTAILSNEKYRGIRPAPGYPACPDHTAKGTLFELLEAERKAGICLTESFAMWPAAAVSGFYFSHPQSQYFGLGRIDRDQVADYAARKGLDVATVERWLGSNLAYEG